jgi:uncharacterized protein
MMGARIAALLAAGTVVIGGAGVAEAQTPADAQAAYNKGDFATALAILQPLAARGSATAEVDLGAMYHDGQGVKQDDTQAVFWFRKAADQGDADGEYRLGLYEYAGVGTPIDYAQAVVLLQKSSDQGDASAMGILAACYDGGHGVPQNYVTAYMWMSRSLAGLDPNSQAHQSAAQSLANIASHMTPEQIAQAQALAANRGAK